MSQEDTQRGEPRRRRRRWLPSPAILIGLLVVIAVVVLVLKAPSISHEFSTVRRHFSVRHLPWLGVAVVAEGLSFWCYALVQRNLLLEGGARLTRHTMVSLAIAATGLTNLLPGGTAPASGWLVSQYRKRGIPMPLALWAVLAGGFAATVSVLLLTLVGAAIAGLLGWLGITLCAVLLAGGAVGLLALVHNVDRADRWLRAHRLGRFDRYLTKLSSQVSEIAQFRASPAGGTRILALSLANWGLDVACLIAAFPLLGLAVPWRAVLFAYAVAQIAGSLAPVPGGIGFVEGGMVGAFTLAGTPVGAALLATIVYRLITSVGVAGVGSAMLVYINRKKSREDAELTPETAALLDGSSEDAGTSDHGPRSSGDTPST
jgi:uncharacterized protein (TIRG00374 family)